MAGVLRALLSASEKAANIARVCRQEGALFQLLIQEKTGADKNKKFIQDFKTLADVIIQEVVRHDVGKQFPDLLHAIHGEESNTFENKLGGHVEVQVCSTEMDTAALLCSVLDGNEEAAGLLAKTIHQEIELRDPAAERLELAIPTSSMGIWIDPIDSTSQYIKGRGDVDPEEGLYPSGLQSALVLIGVYDRGSGEPIMGVINQPFNRCDPGSLRWQGQYHWGVSYQGLSASSLARPAPPPHKELSVVLSSSETEKVKQALVPLCGRRMYRASGAGYKFLCVILGLVDAYVFSENTTFKWDSCAPHAILRSLGGGVADLASCLSHPHGGLPELMYHQPRDGVQGVERWANHGGLVAFLSEQSLKEILSALSGSVLQ
ncbi:UNVERIFIED_CONTAM: hypothetical protein FKN15_016387 [Acipenser sinensis]